MKKTAILFSAALFLAVAGCQKSTEEVNKELYNQVMDVHDEMMPNMGTLHTMRTILREKLAEADSLGMDKTRLEADLALVDSADASMMNWMHAFKPEDYEGEALTEYLTGEVAKVAEMKKVMLRAMKKKEEIEK